MAVLPKLIFLRRHLCCFAARQYEDSQSLRAIAEILKDFFRIPCRPFI